MKEPMHLVFGTSMEVEINKLRCEFMGSFFFFSPTIVKVLDYNMLMNIMYHLIIQIFFTYVGHFINFQVLHYLFQSHGISDIQTNDLIL